MKFGADFLNLDVLQLLEHEFRKLAVPEIPRRNSEHAERPLEADSKRQQQLRRWVGDSCMPELIRSLDASSDNFWNSADFNQADISYIQAFRPVEKMLAALPLAQDPVSYSRLIIFCSSLFLPEADPFPTNLCSLMLNLLYAADERVLEFACLALAFLMTEHRVAAMVVQILNTGALPRFVQLISHSRPNLVVSALDVIHKVVLATDGGALEMLVRSGAAPRLAQSLSHPSVQARQFACAIICEFRTGSQIQRFLEHEATLEPLFDLIRTCSIETIRAKATAVMVNFCSRGSLRQLQFVAEKYREFSSLN